MSLKEKLLKISEFLYLLLIFLIPVNLGKHFEIVDSYVGGVLVDYLVPTIFVQDILAALIIFFWVLSGGLGKLFDKKSDFFDRKYVQYSSLFIFSLLLSTLSSIRFVPSICAWVRVLLYFLIFIYSLTEIPIEDYFFKILDIFSVSVLFLGILGIAQFLTKGSVFDNYLVFGEQPYSAATYGVPAESFFGKRVVPAYGLFRHPNIFGGYLSITLVWLFSFLKSRKFYLLPFLLGAVALLFTFSKISWVVFLFGIILHLIFSKEPRKIEIKKKQAVSVACIVIVISLLIPLLFFSGSGGSSTKNVLLYKRVPADKSISRRLNLAVASYRMAMDNFLFGVGFNNSTVLIDKYNYESTDLRFSQPVHNIFLLLFSEGGIFSLILFCCFIWQCLKKLVNSGYFHVYLIAFLQIILLGCFDHYFITIHQTLLLFWITLGLGLQ